MLAGAGHISPAGGETAKPVRLRRCPATAMPPPGDEPGRLLLADELSPRRKGGSRGDSRRATSLRSTKRRFFMVTGTGSPGRSPWRRARLLAAAAARRAPTRSAADADHLALADGDGGSVRDRRGQAGRRGRRPVELPGERPAHEALRLHAERGGDRGLPARPRRALRRLERRRRGARQAEDPGARSSRRPRTSPAPTRSSTQLGKRNRATRAGAEAVIARMKTRIATVVASMPKAAQPHRLRGAEPRLLLGDVDDVRRAGAQAARPEGHRRRGRQERLRLPEALGRVHRRARAPT